MVKFKRCSLVAYKKNDNCTVIELATKYFGINEQSSNTTMKNEAFCLNYVNSRESKTN